MRLKENPNWRIGIEEEVTVCSTSSVWRVLRNVGDVCFLFLVWERKKKGKRVNVVWESEKRCDVGERAGYPRK